MRVLQVINNLEPAGAEVLLRDLVQRMGSEGFSPEIFLLTSTGSWLEREVREMVPVYDGGTGSLYHPNRIMQLAAHMKRNEGRYDVLHVHLFPAQLYISVLAKRCGWNVPVVSTEHNTTNRRRQVMFRQLDVWMYKQFVSTAGVSDAVSQSLSEWIGSTAGPVIWNGIDLDRFSNQRMTTLKRELQTDLPIALSVGRFYGQKDQSTAIRALRHCNVGLALVGDGPDIDRCRSLAREIGVQDRVWFLGRRDDIPRLVAGADLYIQCSRWEGFGIAAVEAMAGGLPLAVTDVPGLRDVVGPAALFFSSGDFRALANLITTIVNSEALRTDLSTRSLERARKFDIAQTVKQYCAWYSEVVHRQTQAQRSNDLSEWALR